MRLDVAVMVAALAQTGLGVIDETPVKDDSRKWEMKKRRCLSGAEGADAEAASEAETAKHPDATEIKLCFGVFFVYVRHIFNKIY